MVICARGSAFMGYRDITAEELRAVFSYNPDTGEIRKNGVTAGYLTGQGRRYASVRVRKYNVMAHILAWALMTGEWPEMSIDHINRDGLDNRWSNLREADSGQQQANRRGWSKSGVRGVNWDRGKWVAYVRHNGKTKNLGRFETKEAAGSVAERERKRIWGEFAA